MADSHSNSKGAPAGASFTLDVDAIRELAARLGVEREVVIRLVSHPIPPLDSRGTHRFDGQRHIIHVNIARPGEDVTRTLAHELFHAGQCARAGYPADWHDRRNGRSYDTLRLETFARSFADGFVGNGRSLVRAD